jgi:hypothetical protein
MATKIALFVSEEKLKNFTSINQNVSPADLVPYILQAQDIYLQNFIGATYYFQLKDQVLNNTVTQPNQFLLDNYIGPALCNYGLLMAMPFLKYKMFNKSVVSPTSESSENITLDEMKFLQEQVRGTAETYMKRTIEWMVNHPGEYNAYIAPNVLDGQLPERGNPYSNNIVTPKQPYAFRKRLAGNRGLNAVGYYDDGMACLECGPNFYQSKNS